METAWSIDESLPARRDEIPEWVPSSVVTIALGGHLPWKAGGVNCRGELRAVDPIGRRLLIDERMKRVWEELKECSPNEVYVAKASQEWYASDLDNYDIYRFRSSLEDKSYAAYFAQLMKHFVISGFAPVTGPEAGFYSTPYFTAAKICRHEAEHGFILRGLPPPHNELEHALTIVAAHLEKQAQMRAGEAGNGIYFVGRSRGDAKNNPQDISRVACRLIAREHKLLFGQPLYKTVRTTVEVAYGVELNDETVKGWAKEGAEYATDIGE